MMASLESGFKPTEINFKFSSSSLGDSSSSTRRKLVHFIRHGEAFHNVRIIIDLSEFPANFFGFLVEHILSDSWFLLGCSFQMLSFTRQVKPCPLPMESLLDPGLTERGHAQAAELHVFVRQHVKPDLIVVSPLTRALQTASIAFQHAVPHAQSWSNPSSPQSDNDLVMGNISFQSNDAQLPPWISVLIFNFIFWFWNLFTVDVCSPY